MAELIPVWICCGVKGRTGLQGCSLVFDAAVQQQQHPASIPAAHPPHITLPEGPCSTKPDWEAAFQQLEGICCVPAGIYREKAARREAGSAEPEVSLPLLSAPRSFPESKLKNVCLPCQYFSLAPCDGSSNYTCGKQARDLPGKWGMFTTQQNPSCPWQDLKAFFSSGTAKM